MRDSPCCRAPAINSLVYLINKNMPIDRILLPDCLALRKAISNISDREGEAQTSVRINIPEVATVVNIKKPMSLMCTKNELQFFLDGRPRPLNYEQLRDTIGETRWADSGEPALRVASVMPGGFFHAMYCDEGFGLSIQLDMQDQDNHDPEALYAWSLNNPNLPSEEVLVTLKDFTLEQNVAAIIYTLAGGKSESFVPRDTIGDILEHRMRVILLAQTCKKAKSKVTTSVITAIASRTKRLH